MTKAGVPSHELGLIVSGIERRVVIFSHRRRGIEGERSPAFCLIGGLVRRRRGVACFVRSLNGVIVLPHFRSIVEIAEVDVLIGDILSWINSLPHARMLDYFLSLEERCPACFEGGSKGSICLGGVSGVEARSVCQWAVRDRSSELSSLPKKNTFVPMILHPRPVCFPSFLVSHCLRFLSPVLWRQEATLQIR